MNPIELEWKHLKKDELSGKMFEDECSLTYYIFMQFISKTYGNKSKF